MQEGFVTDVEKREENEKMREKKSEQERKEEEKVREKKMPRIIVFITN